MEPHTYDSGYFFVRGLPKASPRPRSRGRGFGVYVPGDADDWKGCVVHYASKHRPPEPLRNPLWVELWFLNKRPKALMRKKDPDGPILCPKKPDRDNLDKAVLDALGSDGWWGDDCQVCMGPPITLYGPKSGETGCLVRVFDLDP